MNLKIQCVGQSRPVLPSRTFCVDVNAMDLPRSIRQPRVAAESLPCGHCYGGTAFFICIK